MYDDFDRLLEEEMKNPKFKKEYEVLDPEYKIIQAMIDARKSHNLTQKQLAQITGIKQSVIARLELRRTDPQLSTLLKLLAPLGKTLAVVPSDPSHSSKGEHHDKKE